MAQNQPKKDQESKQPNRQPNTEKNPSNPKNPAQGNKNPSFKR